MPLEGICHCTANPRSCKILDTQESERLKLPVAFEGLSFVQSSIVQKGLSELSFDLSWYEKHRRSAFPLIDIATPSNTVLGALTMLSAGPNPVACA